MYAQEIPPYAFRFPTGGRLLMDPIVDTTRIWILSEGRQLFTLTETGTVIGKGTINFSEPAYAIPDAFGRLLITDGFSQADLYNERCKLVWSITFNGKLSTAPLFDRDGFLYLCIDRNVLIYTPGGKLRTRYLLPGTPIQTCINNNNSNKLLFAVIRTDTGEIILISIMLPDLRVNQWEISGKPLICIAHNDGVLCSIGNKLYYFSSKNLNPITIAEFPAQILTISLKNEYGAVLLSNNTLYLLLHDKTAWNVQLKADSETKLFISSERIIAYNKKRAQSFSLQGELFREINITNSTTRLVPGKSGIIFSGGADWILYVYQFENLTAQYDAAYSENYQFPARTIVSSELVWLSSGYSDESFLPYLDRASLALQKMEPLSATDYGMLLGAAALVPGENLPDPEKNLSIPLRSRACMLLGNNGDPSAIPWLLETALKETDETLVAAALNAIAAIGLDPYNIVLRKLSQNFTLPRSTQAALALINCVMSIAVSQGISSALFDAAILLTKLQDSRFPEQVRKKALEVQRILLRQ
ncbi:MAG TPA: hypothetical protein PK074_13645 [Spirochaetales bacterium]|nr:hypothetical protein [Spirochaetales bacterium]HQK35761.1 hypothetical protein [Spirochaetales bacterium]HRV27636.1 hypothetical protein [Spirochaetia bacterium]